MTLITTNSGGKTHLFDTASVILPDGSRADALLRDDLFDRLRAIGAPGITDEMGKMTMLETYAAHLAGQAAQAANPPADGKPDLIRRQEETIRAAMGGKQ